MKCLLAETLNRSCASARCCDRGQRGGRAWGWVVPWCAVPTPCRSTCTTQMPGLVGCFGAGVCVCVCAFFFNELAFYMDFGYLSVFDLVSMSGWGVRKLVASSAHKVLQLPRCRGRCCDIVGCLARSLGGVSGVFPFQDS